MTRRTFLSAISVTALAATRPPNIVWILADDMGWGDVSMNGSPDTRTPNIDGIAKAGVRLRQYYANAPECTPTRCALMTGRYPQRVGGLECAIGVNNIGRYDEAEWLQKKGELGLPTTEISIARTLKNAGYDTACIGKWHLGYDPKFGANAHGFDEYFGILGGNANYFTHEELGEGSGQSQLYHNTAKVEEKGYLTDLFTQHAVNWLRQRKDKPFFLYLPYNAPHIPIQDPDDFDPKTNNAPFRDREHKPYVKMIERLDQGIGRVLQQLDAMGAAQNTLLVFMSDNGGDPNGRNFPYRAGKTSVYEGGIRVPCAVRWPGQIPAGRTIEQVSMAMDFFPTALAATGVPTPKDRTFDGINLLPFLTGKSEPVSRTVFWRYKRAENRRKAVRKGDWKYTNDSGAEALFNLAKDEQEKTNRLSEEPQIAQDLKARLAKWENDVQAPRLRDFRK